MFILLFLPTVLGAYYLSAERPVLREAIAQYVMTARGGGWGMRIVGIRIVRADNGERPGYGRAFGRVLTRVFLGAVPVLGGLVQLFDHLWMIWDADRQTWHDKAAGTYVIKT